MNINFQPVHELQAKIDFIQHSSRHKLFEEIRNYVRVTFNRFIGTFKPYGKYCSPIRIVQDIVIGDFLKKNFFFNKNTITVDIWLELRRLLHQVIKIPSSNPLADFDFHRL